MPTYHYRCKNCNYDFTEQQSFTDDPITVCPECGEEQVRKVYSAPPIEFKDLVSIAPTSPSERKRIHVTEQPKQGNESNNQGQQTLENKATRRILWITRILRPQPSIRLAQQLFVRSSCMNGDLFS